MSILANDTIAAIATPVGEGGIGIVRLSGHNAIEIAEKIVKPRRGKNLTDRKSHHIFLSSIVNPEDETEIDEVLVSIMRAPNTYTREDVVEINCHGGVVALRQTLGLVLKAGARASEPGEFTKRAFLNGRIDLTQAEAVIDTIKSKTDAGLKAAISQLTGGLSKDIKAIAEKVASVLMQVEAAVDFSDEDIETLPAAELLVLLEEAQNEIQRLLRTYIKGRIIKEGVRTAIVGRPNVGKSSLLNTLLRKERAIVTPIPGTTRDIIEETINLRGIPLRLLDTAGIRDSSDEIERIGVELTRQTIETAEIVLFVIDGSNDVTREDISLIDDIMETPSILVVNKVDLAKSPSVGDIKLPDSFRAIVEISALTGTGIDNLEQKIEETLFSSGSTSSDSTIITSARHEQLLENAGNVLVEAVSLIRGDQYEELIAMSLKDALDCLGGITGESIGEDVLDRIFSEFCIGK